MTDNILGNVNANSELQPLVSGDLTANGIIKTDNAALAYKFCKRYNIEMDTLSPLED